MAKKRVLMDEIVQFKVSKGMKEAIEEYSSRKAMSLASIFRQYIMKLTDYEEVKFIGDEEEEVEKELPIKGYKETK